MDEHLAREQIARELAGAMRRDGQDDDVSVARDLVGSARADSGREHVDSQCDVVRRPST
jgi:hypothetical protein